jgi:hypothetical protein
MNIFHLLFIFTYKHNNKLFCDTLSDSGNDIRNITSSHNINKIRLNFYKKDILDKLKDSSITNEKKLIYIKFLNNDIKPLDITHGFDDF